MRQNRSPNAHTNWPPGSPSTAFSFFRIVVTEYYVVGLLLAGQIPDAEVLADRTHKQAIDLPGLAQPFGAGIAGMAALGAGRLASARRLLQQAVTGFATDGNTTGAHYRSDPPDSGTCDVW